MKESTLYRRAALAGMGTGVALWYAFTFIARMLGY
jgi:hypothetical protein